MSRSKYPYQIDLFETKHDATSQDDPNGDYVMADDVNELQDAIVAMQESLGVSPQGSYRTVSERLNAAGITAMRVPTLLVHLGSPNTINNAATSQEAIDQYLKYDQVVLGYGAEEVASPVHVSTLEIINGVKATRAVNFYGYIDCGVNSANLSVEQIQVKINLWKNMGVVGIYCDMFGYENGVSRARQNLILDSIHQYGLVAIIHGENPDELLSEIQHPDYNANWIKPNVKAGDIYHFSQFVVDTTIANIYTPIDEMFVKMEKLHDYRNKLSIKIFASGLISTNIGSTTAQNYYDYTHTVAMLCSLDAFGVSNEDNGKNTNLASTYASIALVGQWYSKNPKIIHTGSLYTRQTSFGSITVDTNTRTYLVSGINVPSTYISPIPNSVEGIFIKDGSISDMKIASYNGDRLMEAINNGVTFIDPVRVRGLLDINGSISESMIQANVLKALNAQIGSLEANTAAIGKLTAEEITTGKLTADRISASVIAAINLYAASMEVGSATINTAVIGHLTADHIKASVIEAINISAENISAEKLKATVIEAINISAQDISADRIRANVVTAINMYAEHMQAGSATINSAVIGHLTADHIVANVITAINMSSENAIINNAKISELTAAHIQAAVIDAINMNSDNAVIANAKIGELSADHIVGSVIDAINLSAVNALIDGAKIGTLEASSIQAAVIKAINLSTENATIDNAKIGELTAGHIKGSVIEAVNASIENAVISGAKIGKLEAQSIEAVVINAINANIGSATINAAKIGHLTTEHMTANVVEAINLSAKEAIIDGAKIGILQADSIKANVIQAINLSAEQAVIESAKIGVLTADHIKASVIEAVNLSVTGAVIGQAKIGDLNADKITAGNIHTDRMTANVIDAVNLKAGIITVGSATIESAAIGVLSAAHIQGAVISAINLSAENATINAAKIGVLEAGNIKAGIIDADKIAANAITAVKIAADAVTADKILAGSIVADKIATNAIIADKIAAGAIVAGKLAADAVIAGNISADSISTRELAVDSVEAENIKAGSVVADKIFAGAVTTEKLDAEAVTAEKIKAGAIETDKLAAESVTADKIAAGEIKAGHIEAGSIGTDHLAAGAVVADKIAAGTITGDRILAGTITSGLIQAGAIISTSIAANQITTDHIATAGLDASVIKTGKLDSVHINTDTLTVKHVAAGVITSEHIATQGLDASIIKSGYIEGERIKVGSLEADRLKAGTITSIHIAANAITTRNIQAGSITGDTIQARSITAEHISTKGLDANLITVFGKAGETLIGDGYLRVDGFDVGVIQSDNLVGNGLFMSASSQYGYLRKNPEGEALLGSGLNTEGAHELWKIDLSNDSISGKLAIPGKKPTFIAIGNTVGATNINEDVGRYAYVTVQGNDTLVQVDLHPDNFAVTEKRLQLGKGPGRIMYTGNTLGDHKHFFITNTDPKDVNAPDSFIVVDAPPSSDDLDGDKIPDLYVHHQLVTGNTPYDVCLTSDKLVYITLADQGDILIISANDFPTMYWKPVGVISISPHGMDNYHGGLDGRFGLGYATGGDGASGYTSPEASNGGHVHGGYGAATSSLDQWKPHGIAVSTDESMLYVADFHNGELVVIGRIAPGVTHDMGGMGGMTTMSSGHVHAPTIRNTPTYGGEIHNRIKLGDAPEFIKVVNGKVFVTMFGSDTVAVLDEATIMEVSKPRKHIQVGVKPLDIQTNTDKTQLFVSVNGENRIARIDIATEKVINYISAGANVMGMAVDVGWDGREYLYFVNNGGSSALSFVYPEGPYIGDPYLGLEGAVEYQGAEHWVPNRSDWVYADAEKKRVRDYALVEFRVNEPFLNEGGYTRLSVSGRDSQQALIQQDIYNVTNFSNGNTLDIFERDELTRTLGSASHIFFPKLDWVDPYDPDYDQIAPIVPVFKVYTGVLVPIVNEILVGDVDRKVFKPLYEWVEKPAPVIRFSKDNGLTFEDMDLTSRIFYDEGSKIEFDTPVPANTKVYALTYSYRESYICPPQYYTVYYNKFMEPATSRVEFQTGVVPNEGKVEARYSYVVNSHFKNHNGSVLIAMDEASSKNFKTEFIIEEYVPKFVVFDNQTVRPFTPIEDGVNEEYPGIHYSFTSSDRSVRTRETPVAQISTNGTWVMQNMDPNDERANEAVDGKYPKNVFTWDFMKNSEDAIFRGPHNNPKRYVTVTGPGVKTVTVDMVKTYMIGHCDVWMEWDTKFPLGRTYTYKFAGGTEERDYVTKTYKNVKVESSENGTDWFTWVNYASYNANWFGAHTSIGIEPEVEDGSTNLYASVLSLPARYMRFSTTGWEARDPDTGAILLDSKGAQIKGDTMDIAHCHGYADWEVEYDYVYPQGSELEGQQMASNGKCIITTDIAKAYASIDIDIEYTSWWYMTYIIGPEFGESLVKMPTVMGGSHSLFYEAPFQNKIQHRHTMSMPPGKHRVLIQQNSGKISLDRIRFEDYQYSSRSKVETLENTAPSTFTRYKLVADGSKNYIGRGKQTTEGAFDKPYINPDTKKADRRVPLKYRMIIKALLTNPNAQGALLPETEHGLAYITSIIFETGKQSTSWRMSQTSDSFPGTRIEPWNPSFPHKTGIQNYHLANGSVRGSKILPSAIMGWHISPYARIGEHKLDLNFATHFHGHVHEDGTVFDNKAVIDTIHGWGVVDANKVEYSYSGVLERMARADHSHPNYLDITKGGLISGNLTLAPGVTINGLDLSAHMNDKIIHITEAEHIKLTSVASGAHKVTDPTPGDGLITVTDSTGTATVLTVYTHPTTAGNKHIPAAGVATNFLKWSSAGTAAWADVTWADVIGRPTSTVVNIDDAVTKRHAQNTDTGTSATSFTINNATTGASGLRFTSAWGPYLRWNPAGLFEFYSDWQNTSPAVWAEVRALTFKKSDGTEVSYNGHTHSYTALTDVPTSFTPPIATATILGGVKQGANITIAADGTISGAAPHPTGDGNLHVPANGTSNNGKVLKATAVAGSYTWGTIAWSEIQSVPTTFAPPIATASVLGGVKQGANITIAADGTISSSATYTHPTGAGYNHIPAGGATGNYLKWSALGTAVWSSIAWGDLTGVPTSFTPAAHNQTVSTITDIATYYPRLTSTNIFTDTMTITKAGLGLKIQPSSALSKTILLQVAKNTGENLFSVNSEGDLSVVGSLSVAGNITYVGESVVDGNYAISGDLTVGGSTTLGTGDATDIIRVNGEFRQINTLQTVSRFPVYGPGDVPVEVNGTAFDTIIEDYGTFLTGDGRIPNPVSSAERWYSLLVRYSDEAGSTSTLRIVQDGTTNSAVTLTNATDFDLPSTGKGVGRGARTWISAPFKSTFTGDTIFQVKRNAAGSTVQIKYIEVIVYDKFTS